MKIKKIKNAPKFIVATLICLVFCVALLIMFRYFALNQGGKPTANEINFSPATNREIEEGNRQKRNSLDRGSGDTSSSSDSERLDISIVSAKRSGEVVKIRTLVTQVATGDCLLVVKNGSSTKTYASSLQPLATTSTCQGFDVYMNDIGYGDWELSLKINSIDNKSGEVSMGLEIK